MTKKTILIIDNDVSFIGRFERILDDLGVLGEYNYIPVEASKPSKDEVIKYCITKIQKLLKDNHKIEVVLVDIVIFEKEAQPVDRSGLDIANSLRSIIPGIPIIYMTRFHSAFRLLSETSLDPNLHGLILKSFLEGEGFSRKDFINIVYKARKKALSVEQYHHPNKDERIRAIEGRFQLQDDPRCLYQVLQIGIETFMQILEKTFPSGQGTIEYLRPGFSGSFLFRVVVKTSSKKISPTKTSAWVFKVSDNEEKLNDELQRYIELKNRIAHDFYPQLRIEKLTIVGKWAALALKMREYTITFSDYIQRGHSVKKIAEIINKSLFPFLNTHYGDSRKKQCFLWNTYYSFSEKTKAGILTFINNIQTIKSTRISDFDMQIIERIRLFITSDGKSEESIIKFATEVDTRYIHGDLHCRNIMVTADGQKVIMIDFANSDQEHYMKDIAKLETDLIFLEMDFNNWNFTDWNRLNTWKQIYNLYRNNELFKKLNSKGVSDPEVKRYFNIIQTIRYGLKLLSVDQPNEPQYLIALLYYGLNHLSFPDVSLQKKIFGIRYINKIFDLISTY